MLVSRIITVNRVLLGLLLALLLLTVLMIILPSPHVEMTERRVKSYVLPSNPFAQAAEAYEAIDSPVFSLRFSTPSLELPDLRSHLMYYGTNRRPDARVDQVRLHFSLRGEIQPMSVSPGDPLYLRFNRKATPPRYVFSSENTPTALWIESIPKEKAVSVQVKLCGDEGDIIREPAEFAAFDLKEKEVARLRGGRWQFGEFRVDGTLLARQKGRWYGSDLFLENHGGEEYAFVKGKQRVDFGIGEDRYFLFVDVDDCLIWKDERWQQVNPGEGSQEYPLLCVKKITDRLMNFELWDVEGRRRIPLNLIRSTEILDMTQFERTFKFIGSRTRSQTIVEVEGKRMLLQQHDWLLLSEEGWIKLDTAEAIDDYVDRRLIGVLFVFSGLDDKQKMTGMLYNASRSDHQQLELSIQQKPAQPSPVKERLPPRRRELRQ